MMKELEALKRIDEKNYLTEREHRKFYSIIENALLELKAIKEANPSEALECLEVIGCGREDNMKFREVFEKEYNTILKSLLKAQEQEKVLNEALKLNGEWAEELDYKNDIIRIIYEKNVDIRNLKHYIEVYSDDVTLKVYNGFHNKDEELTQEEFNLLKEMVKQYEKR